MWFPFFKNQLLTSVPFSRWKMSLLHEARALYISCFVFCRTKGVFLEITMHLTAVVLILSVTSIVKGNLRFQSAETSDSDTKRFESVHEKRKKRNNPNSFSPCVDTKYQGLIFDCCESFVCAFYFFLFCDANMLMSLSSFLKGWECSAGCSTENGFCEKPGKCRYWTTSDFCVDSILPQEKQMAFGEIQ